jgi:hypothetical protein
MRIDKETNRVFVRQSWLKDMLLCPERARLAVVQPEFRTQNDSAAIGTAVHAGIEAVLAGNASLADAPEISLIKFKELESAGINHTNVNPDSWHSHVLGLTEAWVKDILPKVPMGGSCEVPFLVPTGTFVNGMELWFEGTMDYLHEAWYLGLEDSGAKVFCAGETIARHSIVNLFLRRSQTWRHPREINFQLRCHDSREQRLRSNCFSS